jgi:hypothetical protein
MYFASADIAVPDHQRAESLPTAYTGAMALLAGHVLLVSPPKVAVPVITMLERVTAP